MSRYDKIILKFANIYVKFVDRNVALRQFEEIAERGTCAPMVIYGPEGCGKTALLKQIAHLFREADYKVVYVNPLENDIHKAVCCSDDVNELVIETVKDLLSIYFGDIVKALAYAGLAVLSRILRRFSKPKVAVLLDDVFQAVGLESTSILSYVKSALNLIEYPPQDYDKVIIVITTSEGMSREEIGRHRWADLYAMWNMTKEGLYELYCQIPGSKPPFEQVWKWTGGNPWILAKLYENNWNVEILINKIVESRRLLSFLRTLNEEERKILTKAVEDVDYLWHSLDKCTSLVRDLVRLNLIMDSLPMREHYLWIDSPPPEKDQELGIGKHMAWQTPLHREAIRKALQLLS